MSDLTTRRFLKMNGLGNEITVLDLRGSTARVSAAEARAIAADPRSHFDQLMVLHDPQSPGTDAFMRIYNTDGIRIRRLRQRHALRRLGDDERSGHAHGRQATASCSRPRSVYCRSSVSRI